MLEIENSKYIEPLLPGESIVWTGRPSSRLAFIVGLPLAAVGLGMTFLFLGKNLLPIMDPAALARAGIVGLIFNSLFLLPVLFLGLVPIRLMLLANSFRYIITNKRICTVRLGRTNKVTSFMRDELTPLLKFPVAGTISLVWEAKAETEKLKDEDDIRRKTIAFFALPPTAIYQIGVDFPTSLSATMMEERKKF